MSITTVWQLFRICYLPCFKCTSADTHEYGCNPDWCSSSPLRCYHGILLGLIAHICFVQKLLYYPPAVIVPCMQGYQTHVCTNAIAGRDPTALLGLDLSGVRPGNTILASAGHGWLTLNRAERFSRAEVNGKSLVCQEGSFLHCYIPHPLYSTGGGWYSMMLMPELPMLAS